jgi:hypothetical protein
MDAGVDLPSNQPCHCRFIDGSALLKWRNEPLKLAGWWMDDRP